MNDLITDVRYATSEAGIPADSPALASAVETEYLDLDGDGVPDAVRTTRTVGFDSTHDGRIDIVETTEELASGIDIAGMPRVIHVTDTVEADLDHDGFVEQIDSVEYDIDVVETSSDSDAPSHP